MSDLREKILTRMQSIRHTSVAGISHQYEDYSYREIRTELAQLFKEGLVTRKSKLLWELSGGAK